MNDQRQDKRKKIALVCSSGGHLAQLLVLSEFWNKYDRFWVTFDKPDAKSVLENERAYWCFSPTNRNLWNLLRNTVLAIKLLRKEKPDLIVSSGAAVAVPFFYIGRLFGIKTAFLEVYDRLNSATLTGKLVYPVANRFFVQWEKQKSFYEDAEFVGELL